MNRDFVGKSNYVLRKVLNRIDSLGIIKDFIESILKIKIEKIELNPYLIEMKNSLPKEENFGIADVRVKTENGEEINVGIQMVDGYYIKNKMLLYYAQIHSNQLKYGDERKTAKTITINILDFEYFNSEKYHNKLEIKTKNSSSEEENIILHVLELPKFKKEKDIKITREEKWMIYLKGSDTEKIIEILSENKVLRELDEKVKEFWKKEKME